MSKTQKADSTKTAETNDQSAAMADPTSTAPSNSPDKVASTATEPNSLQRVGKKVSRTGRNNGGDGSNRGRPGLNTDLTADTLGERQAVSPAETDVIWTNDSKDRWANGQPDMADLLKQRNKIAEKAVEK